MLHESVMFTGVLLLSALINFKGDIKSELKNPLILSLFAYLLMTLPSLINTSAPLLSIMDYSNLIAMVIVFFVTILGFNDIKDIKKVFYFFIVAVLLHSFYVLYLGLTTGKRVFGILNVYYIDFAGLGGVVSLILLIYLKGLKRIFAGIAFIIITVGLILTQTRNAWLSFGFAIITLLIFLIVNAKKYQIKRIFAVTFWVVSVGTIGFTFFIAEDVNSNVTQRLEISKQTTVLNVDDPTNIGGNSFVSRAFIWHTAVMAFLEHPVVGIGVYAFRYVSKMYYKIPKSFYLLYVEHNTPHVTYLQVLTETGIVGFIFFIIFIIAVIRLLFRTSKLPKNSDEATITLMINWSLIYIIFSMFMTESWLYGQYIMWFGVLLGFLVKNYKILTNS